MTEFRSYTIFLIFVFSVFGCKMSVDNGIHVLKIDVKKASKYSSTEIFNSIDVIQLENKNSFLGAIDKMVQVDSLIIALDITFTNQLIIYDLDGTFIRKVGVEGPGPEEYENANSFTIVQTKEGVSEIWLLDDGKGYLAIVKYDLDGNFLGKVNTTLFADSFEFMAPDRLVFSTSNQCNDEFCNSFYATDLNLNLTDLGPSSKEPYIDFWIEPSFPTSCDNNQCAAVSYGENLIYSYTALNGFEERYSVDFGDTREAKNILNDNSNFETYLEELRNGHIYHLDDIVLTEKLLSFSFFYGTKKLTFLKSAESEFLIDELRISPTLGLSGLSISGHSKDAIYFSISPEELALSKSKELMGNDDSIFSGLIPENPNPIILKLKFK